MPQRKLIWGLTGIAAVLGFMLSIQMTSRAPYKGKTTSYIDLRTQVQEQAQIHQILEKDISKAKAQLDEYQAAGGSRTSMREVLLNDEKTVEKQAGITPVSGSGITITIQDDAMLNANPTDIALFPHEADQWLSEVVNTLFGNDASAISINGQRLVTTSSIRLVTGISGTGGVHINGHPITMPYVVTAVGNVKNMEAALTVEQLQNDFNIMGEDFIVKSFTGSKGVTVPGYNGTLPGQWAKEGSTS